MVDNDNAACLAARVALEFFASKLAPANSYQKWKLVLSSAVRPAA